MIPRLPSHVWSRLPHRLLILGAVLTALVSSTGFRCRAEDAPIPLRAQLRQLIVGDRKPSALNPMPVSQSEIGTVRVERVRITPAEGFDAVAAIYRPKADGKFPVVIVQHFLGGSKDHLALVPLMNGLAQRGFLTAAIDGRYRGDRANGKDLNAAIAESLRTGKGRPFLLDTAYDLTRFVDYLVARPDVDADRIGMTGISEGGILTWMTTAIDPRIKVAAPIIGVTCFGEAFQGADTPDNAARLKLFEPALRDFAKAQGEPEVNSKVFRAAWDRLVPGLTDKFDAVHVVPTIAPRPLFLVSHEQDELFPIDGARKVMDRAKARYQEEKVEDRFSTLITPNAKHASFNLGEIGAVLAWLDKWLKAPPPGL